MALPTFLMGCLPTFEVLGWYSTALLVLVRLLQGLSVGGQLMSSLVFVAEGHDRRRWGYIGSFAMTSANVGTLLGGLVGYGMRRCFSPERILGGLWRIPFLCGVFVSLSGFYLKHCVKDHGAPTGGAENSKRDEKTPLELAFSGDNAVSLACVTSAVFLWSGGFYLIFVWLVICMRDLLDEPIQSSFGINAASLFVTMVLLFPLAGWLSDEFGRRPVMTIGAAGIALFGPASMKLVGTGDGALALVSQMALGTLLALYGSPLCAFLIESFTPEARLTSVAIGYNVSMAIAGGMSPSLATWLVRRYGVEGAGYLLSSFALISLCGVHLTPERKAVER